MNNFSNFSQFHPSWEGQDFTKEEFANLVDGLTKKKPNELLLTDGRSFEIAGIAMQIWQKIKGWLGLENQTDLIKVNYNLLKLLRYGEKHHFFNDSQIKELIQKLHTVLNQDNNHSYIKVTNLIQNILPLSDDSLATSLVDREISVYFQQHKDQLTLSFWENLFNKNIAPVHQTTTENENMAKNEPHPTLANDEEPAEHSGEQTKATIRSPDEIAPDLAVHTEEKEPQPILTSDEEPTRQSDEQTQATIDPTEKIVPALMIHTDENENIAEKEPQPALASDEEPPRQSDEQTQATIEPTEEIVPALMVHTDENENIAEKEPQPTLTGDEEPPKQSDEQTQATIEPTEETVPVLKQREDDLLTKANFHLEEKSFAEALPLFEKINSIPKIYECLIGIAEQEENTAPENAIEYYKKALDLQSNQQDPILYQEIARLYQLIDDVPAAISFLETADRIQPNNLKILVDLADLLHKNKSYALAISAYEKAAQVKNTVTPFIDKILECHSELANEAEKNENFSNAINHYKIMLSLDPESYSVTAKKLVQLGSKLEVSHPTPAVEAYFLSLPYIQREMIEPQKLFEIYLFLANEAEKLQELEKSLEYLELAKAVNPREPQILRKLTNLHIAQGNLTKAEMELKSLVDTNLATSEDLETLAELYLTDDRDHEALEIYQKLKLSPKIHECWINIALDAEEDRNYTKAIYCYEQALNHATPQEKQLTASNLFHLGYDNLMQIKENELAKQALDLALSSAQDLSVLPQSGLLEIYLFLSTMTQENDYQLKEKYLQKALEINPNHVKTLLMKSTLDGKQANDDKAIIGFEKAMLLEPQNPLHKQQLIITLLSQADTYYKKGVHDPAGLKQSIIEFIDDFQNSDHGKKITNALGAWRGINSKENLEISNFEENSKTTHQIAVNGLRICKLIETAYDSGKHHMKRAELPKEFSDAIQKIQNSIAIMEEYYETLQDKTDKIIAEINHSAFNDKFSEWKPLPKMTSLESADAIEHQAKKCLKLVTEAMQKKGTVASLTLQKQIETLTELTKPMGWLNNAIHHYRRVIDLGADYGSYCNHLIDAYTKIGNYAAAIQTYEELKNKFPEKPLYIDYRTYSHFAAKSDNQVQLSNQQLFDGLLKASDQYSREENYEEALHSYRLALTKADKKQTPEVAMRLLNLGDKLIHTIHKDVAIEAYKDALIYKNLILISTDRYFNTLIPLALDARSKNNHDERLKYIKEAYALKPDEEVVNAEFGALYLDLGEFKMAISHLEKAAKANPLNKNHQILLTNAENALADSCYAAGLFFHLRQSLISLVKHLTIESSHASDIKNALGANLGWYSSQNKEFRALGQSAKLPKQIEKDSLRAIELVRIAYDGKSNHKQLKEMPVEYINKLEIFEDELINVQTFMRDYPELVDVSNTSQDQIEKAILYYEKAARRFPLIYNDEHYSRLMNAYILKGESAKAINLYRSVIARFPGKSPQISPSAYMQIFDDCYSNKKYEEAKYIIQAAIQTYPGHASLLKRLRLL